MLKRLRAEIFTWEIMEKPQPDEGASEENSSGKGKQVKEGKDEELR